MSKVYSIVIKGKSFDEKANTVTITGTFDPDKIMKKLCRKAGRWILSYEVIEIVKVEESPPAPAQEPEPAPAQEPEPASAPEKPGKDGKKKTKKKGGSLQVVVVVPPPAATADQPEKKPPPPPPKPVSEPPVVAVPSYPAPATGKPVNWYYGGPCQCGCHQRAACCGVHDHPLCTCSCSYGRRHEHCGHSCVFFSEEDSMCRPM